MKVIFNALRYCIFESSESKRNKKNIQDQLNFSGFLLSDLEFYKNKLWELIMKSIRSFKKNDVAFLSEFFREHYCCNKYPVEVADYMAKINEIGICIQKAMFDIDVPFNSNGIFNQERLKIVLEAVMMFIELNKKIEFMKNKTLNVSSDNLFEPIESNIINNYFKGYDLYFRETKIEDMKVTNSNLNDWLCKKKLTPAHIYNETNGRLMDIFGFTYGDIDSLLNNLARLKKRPFQYTPNHINITKKQLCNIFSDIINVENMCNIITFLSINKCFEQDLLVSNRILELRCIIEDKDRLNFAICTLYECLQIFKKISISGQFFKELGIDERYKSDFTLSQQKLSTFFCYVVADLFDKYGYKVPKKENGLVKVEINTIQVVQKKLTFKDIDVLALDKKRKILYNCELKYYKAKMNFSDFTTDALENKKYKNILERERKINQYKAEIISTMFDVSGGSEYDIKSILITSRQNYNSKSIQAYNFEEFKNMLMKPDAL